MLLLLLLLLLVMLLLLLLLLLRWLRRRLLLLLHSPFHHVGPWMPVPSYHFSHCDANKLKDTADNSYGNTFMSDASAVNFTCGSKPFTLRDYQAVGFDKGSVQKKMPTVPEIVALGRNLLGIASSE